jgi:radical SAM superfamily enzyme YgiQ (UPF0313 family)
VFQPGVELPISLGYLAAYLEANACACDILDLRLQAAPETALKEQLESTRYLAIGITASTAGLEMAARTANQVKALAPATKTVIGGWHASALPEATLRMFPQFDYGVHGEGELAFTRLVQLLDGGGDLATVRGLVYRSNGDVIVNPREELISNLDQLPFPSRDKFPVTQYQPTPATRNCLRLPSTGILVGRGCPYNCRFCYKGVWGKSVRFRSPQNVLEEVQFCIDRYGIHDFRFYDDAMTFPAWDLETFCREVIKRGIRISWNCWSRVNNVSEEKLRLMKEAGCYHIKYGIEFGTERVLRLARKGATLAQAREAVRLARKVGIESKGSFIFGIPGETLEECRQTIAFALSNAPDFATFYAFDPIPGSPFHEAIRKGEINPDRDMLPREVTTRLADQAYRRFYLRAGFILRRLAAFFRAPSRELRAVISGGLMLIAYWRNRRAENTSPARTT